MVKTGDTVRFHAETEDWCLADWSMEEGDGFNQFIDCKTSHRISLWTWIKNHQRHLDDLIIKKIFFT